MVAAIAMKPWTIELLETVDAAAELADAAAEVVEARVDVVLEIVEARIGPGRTH